MRADRAGDAGGAGDPGECPVGAGSVHPPPAAGPQDRPGDAVADRFPHGPQNRDGQWDVGRFGAFAEHVQQFVARLVPEVGDVGRAGLAHPEPEHAEQATSAWSSARSSGRGEQRGELQWVQHCALLSLPQHLVGSPPRPGWPERRRRGRRTCRTSPRCRTGGRPSPRRTRALPGGARTSELAAGHPQHLPVVGLVPAEVRLQILGVGSQGRFPVTGQERPHRQPRHVQVTRHQIRRHGRHRSSSGHGRKPVSRHRPDHRPAAAITAIQPAQPNAERRVSPRANVLPYRVGVRLTTGCSGQGWIRVVDEEPLGGIVVDEALLQ